MATDHDHVQPNGRHQGPHHFRCFSRVVSGGRINILKVIEGPVDEAIVVVIGIWLVRCYEGRTLFDCQIGDATCCVFDIRITVHLGNKHVLLVRFP